MISAEILAAALRALADPLEKCMAPPLAPRTSAPRTSAPAPPPLAAPGILLVVLAACAAQTTVPTEASRPSSLEISTNRGVVIGRARDGVREFLGIPYAAPPVGSLRWRAPMPAAAWASPREATRRGFACPQPTEGFSRDTSEDCLNLNVWVPDGATNKLPVLVWIHGGAFYQGSGGDELYDGARLARRGRIIVVTINYRLGALGFLSQRALAREQDRDVLPAFGLLDQRAALQWIQHNIAAFGGDPANVTLNGESAGAWSQCAQLAMPGSRGLFARAIIQSGACSDALYFDADAANKQGDELAAKVGCTGGIAACLRGKSADELVAALPFRRGLLLLPGVWWGPIVDGVELPRMPLAAIRAGDFARVPLIIGTARDEGTLHTMMYKTVSPDELAWFVRTTFGAAAVDPVIARYKRPTPKVALTDIVTDGVFRCNARRVARFVAARGVPVYLYVWTHALDGPPWIHRLGPTHGIDLWFLFGVTTEGGIGPSPAEQPLVELLQELWSNFARTGRPGRGWPRYTAERDEHLTINHPPSVGSGLDRDVCDFWDALSRRRSRPRR